MVIAHNISALNTYKSLGIAGNSADRSMEKLSSGYKINKAADDAAGLSISEKMRSQIRGLNQASTNAANGVSMIQTAEGALNEEHSILQRMRELAVQAATDTNAQEDREALQSEMAQLTSEINRIGATTEFNGMKILNGDKTKKETADAVTEAKSTVTLTLATGGLKNALAKGDQFIIDGQSWKVVAEDGFAKAAITVTLQQVVAGDVAANAVGLTISEIGGAKINSIANTAGAAAKAAVTGIDNSVYFHVGANSNQVINTEFNDMRALRLGIVSEATDASSVAANNGVWAAEANVNNGTNSDNVQFSLNISTREGANNAIDVIDKAIKLVSDERSKYGAIQNRLEYTMNNLNTTAENMTSAESTVRDVDMAEEMMDYTKNNILQQAAQAMLVQANARPQQALQLLQG
ncbi:MAG: flagellin [Clostridia bacterium]|nr:flagellin [Clostridia bacterium]